MSNSAAQALADAFYTLRELEFCRPHEKFPAERENVRLRVALAQKLSDEEFYAFSRELIMAISSYTKDLSSSTGALERAFDGIDEVLEIDYLETKQMMPDAEASERLYEGGGVGVQTSYASIMRMLECLQLPPGSHLIDLGSGFGRVGLSTGLWREDLSFSGYEYVEHRVASSNSSAKRAGVEKRVKFIRQDLSDPSFKIPAADAYFLYDPFSASTYAHVFARLAEIASERAVIVIAKDNAHRNFLGRMNAENWLPPEIIDHGGIMLFRSR